MGKMIFYSARLSKRILIILGLLFCFCYFAVAQNHYYSWDFSDCELKDIVYAVSLDSGISIVADDTVSGKGDLKFAGKDFSAAFEAFLNGNRLYVEKGEVWVVSRFSMKKQNDLYSVDAYDLQPNQILEKISSGIDSILTFDSLPVQKLSVHFKDVTEAALMESLGKRFGNCDVKKTETGFHFAKSSEMRKIDSIEGFIKIENQNQGFLVDVRDCRFSDAVEKLFTATDGKYKNFCLLSGGETRLQRSVFNGKDFTDCLAKLCSQAGCSFVFDDDLIYIFSNGNIKNELISGVRSWRKFYLKYTKAQDFFPLLAKRVGKLETITLPDENTFICYASDKESALINELIGEADIKQQTYLVQLKYIKPSDFLNHLPPGVDKANLYLADENVNLYFKGTDSAYKNLIEQIQICDVPAKRLSYDLLILQYDESSQNTWSSAFSAGKIKMGDRNSASAMLGSVMNFNLNVLTSFGLEFAADLQASIEENKTKVFADTTLHGVSGKQINFKNTNTYRYRDNNVNPETGVPIYSGVTREISSGIKLDVIGWVSGNGMITSSVTASVSRQGTDTSASTGNPPPTSEKIVTTEVCGKSGEPVILSGLIQNADSNQTKRVPVISKIPLLGNLFKSKNKIKETTQMVIYLVPHVEGENLEKTEKSYDSVWVENRISNFNQKIVKKEN